MAASLAPVHNGSLAEITPKNWHRYPQAAPRAAYQPAYVPAYTWNGGVYGDDVILAKTNTLVDDRGIGDYTPRNQDDKRVLPGGALDAVQPPYPPGQTADPDYVFAVDVTAPRGYIGPRDPYSKAVPAAPVISSLSPNTAVAGTASPLSVTVTGTGFTQWTALIVGNIQTPYVQYFSPTKMVVLMDPARSVAGTITVQAWDHSVGSNSSNFTYT